MATKQPKPFASDAQRIAGSWWESRNPRPVGQFLAARERVRESLEAGWSEELVTRALAKFSYVPSRAEYVSQLDRLRTIERGRAGEPPVEAWAAGESGTEEYRFGTGGDYDENGIARDVYRMNRPENQGGDPDW